MKTVTTLEELNAVGAEIGYPFYVFADGSYSSKFVNGKMNAIMTVKKPFAVFGLAGPAEDCTSHGSADTGHNEVPVAELSEIKASLIRGEKLTEEQECLWVFYGELEQVRQYLSDCTVFYEAAECRLIDRGDLQLFTFYLNKISVWGGLAEDSEIYLIQKGTMAQVELYLKDYSLFEKSERELVLRKEPKLLELYLGSFNELCGENENLMYSLAKTDKAFGDWVSRFYQGQIV